MPPNAVPRENGAVSLSPVPAGPRVWVERLRLTNFRNYASVSVSAGPEPVVLTGPNGSGKTNLLEAVSLLTAGQGLRRSPFAELARMGSTDWAVAAAVHTPTGRLDVGTGLKPDSSSTRPGRIVRIDGEDQTGSGILSGLLDVYWLTPAMDGLFTGPASDRRRFLDRLIPSFDPGYRARINQFERAMQQRNKLLADDVRDGARFAAFEHVMAETGVAIAAARAAAVAELSAAIQRRRHKTPAGAFPWAEVAITGTLENALSSQAAVDVEDGYIASLEGARPRDRAAGRTLEGPHRSDLIVGHGPKQMPASVCSTGEQKALLIGLVLAHADLVRQRRDGAAPILLLDEVAAHLDPLRRGALFDELVSMGSQAWLTGTDIQAFSALTGSARFHHVEDGRVAAIG